MDNGSHPGKISVLKDKINSIQEHLNSIPPPPSVTDPSVRIDEALEVLQQYYSTSEFCDTTATPVSKLISDVKENKYKHAEELIAFHLYSNWHGMCEKLDQLHENIRQRYIVHETTSFVGTPDTPIQFEIALPDDIMDMMPHSVSSPASTISDPLAIEFTRRRQTACKRTKRQPTQSPAKKKSPKRLKIANKRGKHQLERALSNDLLSRKKSAVVTASTMLEHKFKPKTIAVEKKKVSLSCPQPPVSTLDSKSDDLSIHHRKKLLWATTQALKTLFPDVCGAAFKQHLNPLFRLCKAQWLLLRDNSTTSESQLAKGTSDRMYDLALKLAPQVMERVK